jgi:hypothetical protein
MRCIALPTITGNYGLHAANVIAVGTATTKINVLADGNVPHGIIADVSLGCQLLENHGNLRN